MKRRSARPVVVEVKRTRSSASSLADAFARNHAGAGLWQGVPLRVEAPAASRRAVAQAAAPVPAAEPEARPAPRVLPSLVPMYAASEAEPQEEAVPAPPPAPRRLGAERKPPARRMAPDPVSAPEAPKPALHQLPGAASAPVAPPAARSLPAERPAATPQPRPDRALRDGHPPELRRGERWKRRLPRSCW
ncbi:hypothetical protein [Methylobacterium durans]|uniref:Uncharacterized protein n=1 Tax=Methylobacterium durans TaxID=2202825 RepID=A0A2U8WE68_9HYPH|nr:hypothetical protein [Methylobacterium durans]AWN43606.1 hypothetical protein DK389_27735 [Methylobacterium durans]